MRPLLIAGLVVVVVGGLLLFGGLSYTTKEDVVRIGPVKASVEEKHAVPPWVGGLVLAVGVGLIVAGVRRRR